MVQRLTARIGRAAAWFIPTWILLLAALPFTGLGIGACLAGATLIAVAAVILAERRRNRRLGAATSAAAGAPVARRPMGAAAGAGIALGAVALIAYVLLVLRAT
jgi:hypothetical protein